VKGLNPDSLSYMTILFIQDKCLCHGAAEAKQKFSEVLRAANKGPQQILNRGRLVAAVVDAATFEKFQAWQKQQNESSLADVFCRAPPATPGRTLHAGHSMSAILPTAVLPS
jgi:prevent-host-death family protein